MWKYKFCEDQAQAFLNSISYDDKSKKYSISLYNNLCFMDISKRKWNWHELATIYLNNYTSVKCKKEIEFKTSKTKFTVCCKDKSLLITFVLSFRDRILDNFN